MSRRLKQVHDNAFGRFMEHMPRPDSDLVVVVLKAHLLIEEQVWGVVVGRLSLNDDARKRFSDTFDFGHLALIAEAAVPAKDVEFYDAGWVWKAVEKINTLRNRIAHDLEPAGLDDRLKDISDAVLMDYEKREPRSDFYLVVFNVCAVLSNLARPVTESDLVDDQ